MSANYSSSNPFRRKGPPAPAPTLSDSPSTISNHIAHQAADIQPAPPPLENPPAPKKITKKVRVQSPPPLSPDSPVAQDYPVYVNPPTLLQRDNDPFDATASDISEDGEVSRPAKVPANPFSKTLETMEHPEREGSTNPPPNVLGEGRASMDVEAFKRLLMTGNSGLGPSTPSAATSAQVAHHALAASGDSSTDTSSLSRQSIFEAIQEPHPESPRTSHEIEEPEDYRRGLAPALPVARKKPPPPSSRHGKLIKVELRDDLPLQSPATPGSGGSQQFYLALSDPNRSQTDLNKPLPPAPRRESHDSDRESIFDKEAAGKTPEPPSPSSSIRRKQPPAPPLARRHSQMISDSKITRSDLGRLSPKVEEDTLSIYGKENKESTRSRSDSFKAAPPPPPSRRPGTIRTSSGHQPLTSPSSISLPPPPPARGSSRSLSGGSRPASVMSMDLSSPGATKRTSMLPPPPPPRHTHGKAADSQSPPTSRGPSGEYSRKSMESARRESLDIPEEVEDDAKKQDKPDVLAGLTRLQREIDELRVQGERRAS